MKKLLIGLMVLVSIGAHADCRSEIKSKLLHIEEVNTYHSELSKNIEEAHKYRAFDTYSDLKKANDKLWEKVEKLAAQVCDSDV
jgi:hypothetical protein